MRMRQDRLNVAFVGTYQANQDVGSALVALERSIKGLESLAASEDFNFHPIREGIVTREGAAKVREELEKKGIDFLLVQSTTISTQGSILELSKINARLGLWSLPETTEEGDFPPINSFCGMNMFGSVIGEYLKDHNISFKWFFGQATDELFLNRFKLTLRVLRALKCMANSRISLIGGVAPGFHDLYCDERPLQFKYRVSIHINELSEVLQKVMSYDEDLR